jgi:hypothetical protein
MALCSAFPMRRLASPLATLAALLALAGAASGQVDAPSTRTIDVSEITPGMRGYGLTVFRGTTVERFDVEVIDVLHNFRPDQDLILVRTPHPVLDEAHVVGGMSGSPIYFDGRLAGAYAYGWPFSSEPVAGVTPIRNMLTELRRPVRPGTFPLGPPLGIGTAAAPVRPSRSRLAGLPPRRGPRPDFDALAPLRDHVARVGAHEGGPETLRPVATPLLLGGFDGAIARALGAELDGLDLDVLQAGGSSPPTPETRALAFEDGGAVGVTLIQGDMSATAVGTVTLVDGDRVAAFGHPMLNAGQPGLPTAVARVIHVLANDNRSFKIAEAVRPLGTMVQDRQSAIVLDTSIRPATVPVHLRLRGVEDAGRSEWHMEVASHRVLTPALLVAALGNAMTATASDRDEVTFAATQRIRVEGRSTPIEMTDHGFVTGGLSRGLAQLRLFRVIDAVYGNPFELARIESIDVDIDVRFGRDSLAIVDAAVGQREVDPGQTVPIRVVLRAWEGVEEVRTLEVEIPEALAGQSVELRLEAGAAVRPALPQARDLDELLDVVTAQYARTSVVASLRTPSRGLRLGGHVLRRLPASALDTLQLRQDADRARPFVTYDRVELPLDAVVTGGVALQLEVRDAPRRGGDGR